MLKTVRVNMETKQISFEEFDTSIMLGNRGLIAKTLLEEVEPNCDPLGPKNKLVFATGLFAGYNFPTGNRLSVGAKSPLTGTIKESNVGGTQAYNMAMQGIKMIIIENAPTDESYYILKIDADGSVSLEPADQFQGKETYETVEKLREKTGKQASICLIGPGGERRYKVASIQVTEFASGQPVRAAGRGGLGAVMGSKGLKAIIIERPDKKVALPVVDDQKVKSIIRELVKNVLEFPVTIDRHKHGTYGATPFSIATNNYPIKNFSGEMMTPENVKKVGLHAFTDRIKSYGGREGTSCQVGCPIKCSNQYNDKDGNMYTASLEYETIALCGPNCDIYDWEYIAEFDRTCDEVGVDTIDVADAIAVAMDAGYIPWGDTEAARGLLKELREGTGFGNILGNGTQAVGDYLKAERIPTFKGQSFPAWDPRAFKGMGVTYSTNAQGADHTLGVTMTVPDLDHSDPIPQPAASKKRQFLFAAMDNMCCTINQTMITNPITAKYIPELASAVYGTDEDPDLIINIGRQTVEYELEFNKRAGINDTSVPEFIRTQKLEKTKQAFDVDQELLDHLWDDMEVQ